MQATENWASGITVRKLLSR